jgi:hypothetical protein
MARCGVVRGGVLARGVVAAADVPTAMAHAQVDPLHAELEALLATGDLGRGVEDLDRAEVGAGLRREPTIAQAIELPGSRIIPICDAYMAMKSAQPYRRPMSSAEAVAELRRAAGVQFDPRLVEPFEENVIPVAEPRSSVQG